VELFDALETFGVPITMCIAFGYFIWKQNKWIQDDLKKDILGICETVVEQNSRLENIIIGLINTIKKFQIEQGREVSRLEGSYRSLQSIIQKLSGNGLKKK
jgi:hypothetical protein